MSVFTDVLKLLDQWQRAYNKFTFQGVILHGYPPLPIVRQLRPLPLPPPTQGKHLGKSQSIDFSISVGFLLIQYCFLLIFTASFHRRFLYVASLLLIEFELNCFGMYCIWGNTIMFKVLLLHVSKAATKEINKSKTQFVLCSKMKSGRHVVESLY